jgi:hypothetical protein
MYRIFIFSIVTVFLGLGCKDDAKQTQNTQNAATSTTNASKFSTLAQAYCECSSELIALNNKAKYLVSHPEELKNTDEIADLLAQSEQLQQRQVDCQNQLEQQYQTKIAVENMEVLDALRQHCPALAEFMVNAKKNEEQ